MDYKNAKYPAIAAATQIALESPPPITVSRLTREINAAIGQHPPIKTQAVSHFKFGKHRMDYWMALYLYNAPESTIRVRRLALACLQDYAPEVWAGAQA